MKVKARIEGSGKSRDLEIHVNVDLEIEMTTEELMEVGRQNEQGYRLLLQLLQEQEQKQENKGA